MQRDPNSSQPTGFSRRGFVKTSAVASGAALMASMGTNFAHAQGSDRIRVGLIGAGGRGSGAVGNVQNAAKICKTELSVEAVCDVFKEANPGGGPATADRAKRWGVKDDKVFYGLEGYKQLLEDKDLNYIILATPPGFRPMHFEAAVNAGKHIFCEKPVAVDPTGIRRFLKAVEVSKEKKLGVAAGTQRRHQKNYLETIKRIQDGAIGDITHMSVYWNQGSLWNRGRKPEWSDLEWQLRNWYYFVYFCGDHIVEQHVHNLDVANWVMGANPISAYGMGGRQVRTDPAYGHIYDHFSIEYEYPNGGRVLSQCRHHDNTDNNVSEFAIGTKGSANPANQISVKGGETWRYRGEGDVDPYVQEHVDLINSIREGKPINEGEQVANSTMVAIMGRMSAYTGRRIYWDKKAAGNARNAVTAMENELDTMPKVLEFGPPMPVPPVPMPGQRA